MLAWKAEDIAEEITWEEAQDWVLWDQWAWMEALEWESMELLQQQVAILA